MNAYCRGCNTQLIVAVEMSFNSECEKTEVSYGGKDCLDYGLGWVCSPLASMPE